MEQTWITTAGLRDYYEGWVAHYAGDGTYDAGYSTYGSYYSTKYGMYQWTDKHYFTYGGVHTVLTMQTLHIKIIPQ